MSVGLKYSSVFRSHVWTKCHLFQCVCLKSSDFTVACTHCSADALNPRSKTFHSAENSKALLSPHLKSLNNWAEVTCGGGQPPGEQKVNFKETKRCQIKA